MKRNAIGAEIDRLIDQWAMTLGDTEFIEALEELEDRARTAREARQEELGDVD